MAYGFKTLEVGFAVLYDPVRDGEMLQQCNNTRCPTCGGDFGQLKQNGWDLLGW